MPEQTKHELGRHVQANMLMTEEETRSVLFSVTIANSYYVKFKSFFCLFASDVEPLRTEESPSNVYVNAQKH